MYQVFVRAGVGNLVMRMFSECLLTLDSQNSAIY